MYTRKELPRTTPESVGISCRDILRLIESLENSGTEMHGLIILRHGKTVAEGWWAPYAPGMIHGSQSLSKTVTGAAFGIAKREGLVDIDDRLMDIFPEFVPENPGPYLNDLRMRHILTMSSGMETMPAVTDPDWIRRFFTTPIVHPPGTAFFYNSIACSMVGACIRKKTGLGLREFLRTRLFDKIGIDTDAINWYLHGDGLENGSGGIVTTTEDNARLLQLYLQAGVWEGERLLPQDWVTMATSMQNDHFKGSVENTEPHVGYGGMMWIRDNTYYADGAMNQLAIGFPEQDMVISVNQTCSSAAADKKVRSALFGFAEFVKAAPLPDDPEALSALNKKLTTLAIKAPAYAPYSPCISKINGRKCRITDGHAAFFAEDLCIFNLSYQEEVFAFGFDFDKRALRLTIESQSGEQQAVVGLDGRRRDNHLVSRIPAAEAVLSASWPEENVLLLDIRWLESCRSRQIAFRFDEGGAVITSSVASVGAFDTPPHTAIAVWQ